jgi:hypothetical protein
LVEQYTLLEVMRLREERGVEGREEERSGVVRRGERRGEERRGEERRGEKRQLQ